MPCLCWTRAMLVGMLVHFSYCVWENKRLKSILLLLFDSGIFWRGLYDVNSWYKGIQHFYSVLNYFIDHDSFVLQCELHLTKY